MIASMPFLKSFNEQEISAMERVDSIRTLRPVKIIHDLSQSHQFALQQAQSQGGVVYNGGVINKSTLFRGGRVGGFRKPVGVILVGPRSSAVAGIGVDEQAITDLCQEIAVTASIRRAIAPDFENSIKLAVQQIFLESVTILLNDREIDKT